MTQARPERHAFAAGFALIAGLALALVDARPGFDATGVMAGALILAGAFAGLLDGSAGFVWALLLTALIGGPIVLLERQSFPATAIALAFAGIGAFAVAWSARLRRSGEDI